MFMSVATRTDGAPVYAELAGSRVLITGLTAGLGVDVARAFADHKARLILQSPEGSPEVAELAAILAETATDMKLFIDMPLDGDGAVRLAQTAAATFGGLDAVINLVSVEPSELVGLETVDDIEQLVSSKLLAPTLIGRVAANRMRLTLTQGLVLNVVVMPPPRSADEVALASILRAGLAALTRGEATDWASQDIRINGVGPRSLDGDAGATLDSEPDIAALALYLASRKGRSLSGHVFDAVGVARRGC